MWELDVPARVTFWEIAKGLLFIVISGACFYWVVRRLLNRLLHSEVSLQQSERERVALEHRLAQSKKLEGIGRVAGGIAHDFNNILTSILSAAHLLQDSVKDENARGWIKTISDAADRGAGLTRQLLSFGQRGRPELKPVSLNEVITGTAGVVKPLLAQNVVLELKLSPDAATILADESQLTQVLMNFCINARDALPHGGKISVRTENLELTESLLREHPEMKPGPYVLLTVSDNGTGMSPDVLDHIFEPFFTTKARNKGTGLGLSTVYGIVRQTGGCIDVESEVGRGSTFRVYFPAQPAGRPGVLSFPSETSPAEA
jgi:signal transduction histidine kinase